MTDDREASPTMLLCLIVVLGLAALLVMAAPQLVVLGFICLIIPGIILATIPTLFTYAFATGVIRLCLPRAMGLWALLVAFGLALGLSGLVMSAWRIKEERTFAQAVLPAVTPPDRLALSGDIFVDWSQEVHRPKDEVYCDYVTTALLDIPGVTSVTRKTDQGTATFRLGAGNTGELVMPHEPQRILEKFARYEEDRRFHGFEARRKAEQAVLAAWALRIANGDELRRDAPVAPAEIDWTIELRRNKEPGQPTVDCLEVRDAQGHVRARNTLVKHFLPAPLFYWGFESGSSADGYQGARFTVGGSTASNQRRFYDFDAAVELLRLVGIPRPSAEPKDSTQLEQELLAALDNPRATEPELMLAPLWLKQFQYNAGKEQLETIRGILLDERIPDPAEWLRESLSSRVDLTPLREGLAKRCLAATDTRSKSWYATALVELPDGAFAQPTDAERELWREAFSAHESAPFVERMADQGTSALPTLMDLLDQALTVPWHARWRVLRGIREACKRLGPDAATAIPRIRSLIADSPHTLLNSANDRLEWQVALHLMGVAAEDLPYVVKNPDAAQIASEFQRIQQRARRYQDERTSRDRK